MRKWIMGVSAVLALFMVGSAWAGEGEAGGERKPRKERRKKKEGAARQKRVAGPRSFGRVKSVDVDGGKIVVMTRKRGEKKPVEKTFVINAETKVKVGNEDKTLQDLGEGKNVTIMFKGGEEGEDAVATLIMMRLPMAFGKIKSVDAAAKKMVITTRKRGKKETVEMTFLVDEDTKIRVGRDEKTLEDLAEGNNVTVEYKEAKEGEDATAVNVRARTAQPRRKRPEKKKEEA